MHFGKNINLKNSWKIVMLLILFVGTEGRNQSPKYEYRQSPKVLGYNLSSASRINPFPTSR